MDLTLKIWRQENAQAKGKFETYKVTGISENASFLEMLDILNESIVDRVQLPIAFDHDCREGICGMCSLYINGRPHGPDQGITVCQMHMRNFKDGSTIVIEPWRARPFPVIKDLMIDRSAFDLIIQAGGYVSVHTGGVNHILTEKGSVREPLYLIPFRPGHPILDLQDQPKYDVDEKSAKQDNLKYFDKGIAGHEMNCNLENFHMISRYW